MTQLCYVERNLDQMKYLLPPDSVELDLILKSLNEMYNLITTVKSAQSFPKRKD